jgi:hypothetical protein
MSERESKHPYLLKKRGDELLAARCKPLAAR